MTNEQLLRSIIREQIMLEARDPRDPKDPTNIAHTVKQYIISQGKAGLAAAALATALAGATTDIMASRGMNAEQNRDLHSQVVQIVQTDLEDKRRKEVAQTRTKRVKPPEKKSMLAKLFGR